jgi:Flp pilus assembly protein TadG
MVVSLPAWTRDWRIGRSLPRTVRARRARRGAAVVELAVLLPLLIFLFVIAVDFARIYYVSLTLTNAARAGALYASDPGYANESPFANCVEAARADTTNLTPQPMITQITGTDAEGRAYVEVTAMYKFETISSFPGVPSDLTLRRTVRMFVMSTTPSTN